MRTSRTVATVAYNRCESLGAIATYACDTSGRPPVSFRQFLPPSVDLKIPPFVPAYSLPNSQGACRDSHSEAYSTYGCAKSIVISEAPVFSSTYKDLFQVWPPSVETNTPRSALGP